MTYCFLWASRFHLFNSFICDCFSISFVCLVSSSRLVSSSSCLLSSSPLFISSPHLVSSPRLLISSPLLTSSPHLVSCPPLLVSSPRLGSSSVFLARLCPRITDYGSSAIGFTSFYLPLSLCVFFSFLLVFFLDVSSHLYKVCPSVRP